MQHAREIDQLVDSMEACLAEDFDGFEILLSGVFIGHQHYLLSGDDTLRHFWNDSSGEKIIVVLQISTAASGKIGQLSLHRKVGGELLIDTGLLAGDLRRSLGIALEKCFKNAAPSYVVAKPKQPSLAHTQASGD